MERIRTGNAHLDEILHGGFPADAIHIVMGTPGTGKTILAEQLAFENASPDRTALYLTTLSEPLAKFLSFLQEYTFADVSRVGTEVIYESLEEGLAEHPEQLADRITAYLHQYRPRILIIDSFKALADLMPDMATWRRQLYELAGVLTAYRTTTFLVGEYESDAVGRLPEFAVVDGILELTREQHGSRDFRFARVVKLRGSGFLDGRHAVQLTRSGLRVYPRLVTPHSQPDYAPLEERIRSGVPGLDTMIENGWLRGTTTLVQGPSGSGKTILSLQFLLEGVRSGEPCLFVNFEENPVQIARVMRSMGWAPESYLGPGKLDIFFTSPVELQIDTIVGALFERVEAHQVRRVVIDGLGDLTAAADDPSRIRDYVFSLTQQLASRNVTSLITLQHAPGAPALDVSYVADNVLRLDVQMDDELHRSIRVAKSRGSAHDGRRHLIEIKPGGMEVV